MKQARIIYSALGSGLGHLTRAVAITRKLKGELLILTNSPFAFWTEKEQLPCKFISSKNQEELLQKLEEITVSFQPNIVVADTFPFRNNISLLLEKTNCQKVFVKRNMKESVLESILPALESYSLIIEVEDKQLTLPASVQVCPVVIRDSDELLPKEEIRHLLKVNPDKFLLLALSSQNREKTRQLFKLILKISRRLQNPNLELRFISPYSFKEEEISAFHFHYYPAVELFKGVDLLIGNGGYNLFYESAISQTPAIFIPTEQQTDNQFSRTNNLPQASNPYQLEQLIKDQLTLKKSVISQPKKENRADKTAQFILNIPICV